MNYLKKKELTPIDIIRLNELIFKKPQTTGKYRSYDKKSIMKILEYQKKNQMNNTKVAKHFNISRNSVAKWKKFFLLQDNQQESLQTIKK